MALYTDAVRRKFAPRTVTLEIRRHNNLYAPWFADTQSAECALIPDRARADDIISLKKPNLIERDRRAGKELREKCR